MAFNAATGYGGMALEATPNVDTAPDAFYPFQDIDIDFTDELIEWQEIRGSRQAKQAQDGAVRPSVTMSGAVYPIGVMGMLLRGLLGDVESGADGSSSSAKKHVFRDAASLPTFSIERSTGYAEDGEVFAERVSGAKVESLSFSASFGEQVTFDATLQAATMPKAVTAASRNQVIYPDVAPIYFGGATVEVNGTPNSRFKSISMEFTNTLERQETLNGTRTAYAIHEGAFEATLSGTMVFENEEFYEYLIEGREINANIFMGNGAYTDQSADLQFGLGFEFPRLRVTQHSIPFSAGSTIEADVTFSVLYDPQEKAMVIPSLHNLEDGSNY